MARVVFRAAALVCFFSAVVLGQAAALETNATIAVITLGAAIVMTGAGAGMWKGGEV
jgi:hypothetical protein